MTEYNAGDLVEAVKGETVTRGRLREDELGLHLWVGDSGRTPENLESYGFTLSLIEKAAAVVVLPSEPGLYTTDTRDLTRSVPLYRLAENGEWSTIWPHRGEETRTPAEILDGTKPETLTRLEPVSETAKKVLDRIRADCNGDGGYYDHQYTARQLRELFAEFGVTK